MSNEIVDIGCHRFKFGDQFSFCGYQIGGFKLCSKDTQVSILKSDIEYTKFGAIKTKEDFANFIFGLTDISYFSSVYHNGDKIAYAIYKPIFLSNYRQMTCLITTNKEVFAITFKCLPSVIQENHKVFLEWVKSITIEYSL